MHKAGFVNIVGNPNVGKSTLMNQLVGERISIATFKAQTTRHRIMGIVNRDDMQIVFSDTPGVLKPNYKLQESMLAFSESALTDADILLYVTDVVENPEKNIDFLEKVGRMDVPVLLLINKIDESDQKTLGDIVEKWHGLLPKAEILPISAKNKFGIDMPLPHTGFRDHRTFIYEAARLICKARGWSYVPSKAYNLVEDYKSIEKGAEHDPVFDCNRSIYTTWQMMRKLDFLKPIPIQQINNQQSTINNQ